MLLYRCEIEEILSALSQMELMYINKTMKDLLISKMTWILEQSKMSDVGTISIASIPVQHFSKNIEHDSLDVC